MAGKTLRTPQNRVRRRGGGVQRVEKLGPGEREGDETIGLEEGLRRANTGGADIRKGDRGKGLQEDPPATSCPRVLGAPYVCPRARG